MDELNLTDEPEPASPLFAGLRRLVVGRGSAPSSSSTPPPLGAKDFIVSAPFNPDEVREAARGDLARGLLWLLTFAIGGVLAFVGLGRLDGSVITQSIFPSLVALAGTALGFYFGSSAKSADSGTAPMSAGGAAPGTASRTPPVANAGPDQTVKVGSTVAIKGSGASAFGTQLTYAWALTLLPAGSLATLTMVNGVSATFVADLPGTYVAQLTVNDGLASAPSTTNVTVS